MKVRNLIGLVLAVAVPVLQADARQKGRKLPPPVPVSVTDPLTEDVVVKLDVPIFNEEGWYSCWSTCGQMVTATLDYRPDGISQCTQAVWALSKPYALCCQSDILSPACDYSGYPDFPHWGYGNTLTNNTKRPLQWEVITAEIDAKRPLCYSYPLAQGVNHMIVIYGYQVASGTKYLLCLKPGARAATTQISIDFDLVYSGAGYGGQGHDCDFYNIQH